MPHRNNKPLHPNARAVLDALRVDQSAGLRPTRTRELIAGSGLSKHLVNRSLSELRERALVTSPSHGHWIAVRRVAAHAPSLPPQAFGWLESAISQCAGVAEGMDGDDPVAVELTLAKHHLVAALDRARG